MTALNLLFFGNSLTQYGNVPGLVAELATAAGYETPVVVADLVGGSYISEATTRVASSPTNNVTNTALPTGDTWDYVVMQGYSTEATAAFDSYAGFAARVVTLFEAVRDHASGNGAGVIPVLYQTFANRAGSSFYPGTWANESAMHADIMAGYAAALAALPSGARLGRVGEAFAADSWPSDFYHIAAGDYTHAGSLGPALVAMLLYQAIYGGSASAISFAAADAAGATSYWDSFQTVTLDAGDWARLVAIADALSDAAANVPPVAVLGVDINVGRPPLTVAFDATDSYDPDGAVAAMSLDFGDGSEPEDLTGSGVTLHEYATAGSYTATLTVTDNLGAYTTATASITATARKNPVPTAALDVITALSEQDRLNTEAPLYDVQLRYFSGPKFRDARNTGMRAILDTWSGPEVEPPPGWQEITARVSFEGSESITQSGSSITYEAALRGTDYDEALLGIGRLIACWQRVYRGTWTDTEAAGWQDWQLAYIGQVASEDYADDWQRGGRWRRTVRGYDAYLERYNAPRTTAGKVNVVTGATVTGTVALANPGLEADQGEFVGGNALVDLANVVDGNPATVYISSTAPTMTDPGAPVGLYDGEIIITEVSIWPVAGFPASRCWWIEFYNQRTASNDSGFTVTTASWNGGAPIIYRTLEAPERIGSEAWGVVCASQYWFERAWGGQGGSILSDLSKWASAAPAPDPLDGLLVIGGAAIAWAPGGASRTYTRDGHELWNGPTFDSDVMGPGTSLVYDWITETWSINATPNPGASRLGDGPVWVQVTLDENACVTTAEIDATSVAIPVSDTVGWVIPPDRTSSQGIVGSCVFNWTGKSGSALTGVTWEDTPGAAIPEGAACLPYENGEAQTGRPLTATHLVRRKTPTIESYDVYWSNFAARGFDEEGWRADYYAQTHHVDSTAGALRLTDSLSDGTSGYLWVRSWMYLVNLMSDAGRCKINEIEADLHQLAIDYGPLPYVDGARVIDLARSLWADWAGLAGADFVDEADTYNHYAGAHSIAVAPITSVYDDLAKMAGCLVYYGVDGRVHWLDDPWWPGLSTLAERTYTFTRGGVRDEITVHADAVTVDYVIVNAMSFEGSPHPVRVVYPTPPGGQMPPTWAMVNEVAGLIVARDADATSAARRELSRLTMGNRRANVVVKGVATWARPGLRVGLRWDLSGAGTDSETEWVIEKVTQSRTVDGDRRAHQTTLELRSFQSSDGDEGV